MMLQCTLCGRDLAELDEPPRGVLFSARKMLAGFGMDLGDLQLDPPTLAREFKLRHPGECPNG